MINTRSSKILSALAIDYCDRPTVGTIVRRGNARHTAAIIPRESRHFEKLSGGDAADDTIAVLYVEALAPHPDGLSVAGTYLISDDNDFAPTTIGVVEITDIDRICDDDSPEMECMYRGGW